MTHVYPTLEDMKVDEVLRAQAAQVPPQPAQPAQQSYQYPPQGQPQSQYQYPMQTTSMYPSLASYMGLDLDAVAQQHSVSIYPDGPVVPYTPQQSLAVRPTVGNAVSIAPVTGNDLGMLRAEIKPGIRRVVVCKDAKGFVGLRVRHFDTGIFICFVERSSAASKAGLRFADQVLEINGQVVAGWTWEKFHSVVKKADPQRIELAIRDRPFCRTVTLHKDSHGGLGFTFKNGKIGAIVKDSSAARNGLLTDHHLIEVDGTCVVGLSDKNISNLIRDSSSPVTVSYMPEFLYQHIVKSMGSGLFKKQDHSEPEI